MINTDPNQDRPSVDDPDCINRFLAIIQGTPVGTESSPPSSLSSEETIVADLKQASTPSPKPEEQESEAHIVSSNLTSGAASPNDGARAPPSTPASKAVRHADDQDAVEMTANEAMQALISIADRSRQGLMDSKFAGKKYRPKNLGEHSLSTSTSHAPDQASSKTVQKLHAPAIQSCSVEDSKNKTVSFVETVLSEWKRGRPDIGVEEAITQANTVANSKLTSTILPETEPFPPFEDICEVRVSFPRSNGHCEPQCSSFRATAETFFPLGQGSELQDNSNVKQHDTNKGMAKVDQDGDTPTASIGGNQLPIIVTSLVERLEEKLEGEVDEDRENETYFKSWGTAAPRSMPPSRVRKIILSNLPTNADNSLVASLVHGGAIESYKLTKPSEFINTSTATILFTTGDAADTYYHKYPNGVQFRFQGRKHVAFVDKGTQVDVISGVMRGYLESGASRVVRATGVEEDWSMLALRSQAEKKGRKLEAILDSYRDEIRTIVYRFTNIADAVQFKGELIRNDEFEGCNIQFADDPCEKETTVHMD